MRKIVLVLSFVLLNQFLLAQTGNIKIGADPSSWRGTQGGFYDYSDPEAVNIKVSVWGFVRFPGRYLVPSYSNLKDLLSYAGGPSDDAHLDGFMGTRALSTISTLPGCDCSLIRAS